MEISRLVIGLVILFGAVQSAFSAPFCAVFSYGKQCYYYSYDQCLQAAGSQGACITNDEEVRAPSSGAPFCVVASFGTQCFYYDASSCRQAAAAAGGACAVNPNR